jgi:hypothetical protein
MKKGVLIERIGIIGVFLTALTSPCCFPLFGVILSTMGLGSFELFGGSVSCPPIQENKKCC